MPIDDAMRSEIAEAWFAPFLAHAQMSPTHPLRQKCAEDAEGAVRESYREDAISIANDEATLKRYDEIAEDVIQVLYGVAEQVAHEQKGD